MSARSPAPSARSRGPIAPSRGPTASPLELSGYAPPVQMGSNRAFGIVFTVLFAAFGCFPMVRGQAPTTWLLLASGGVLALALAKPEWLAPFNKVWFRLGMLLHRIVSPVIMALVYVLAVTPTGLLLRLLRKDILRLRWDPKADSYWIRRESQGPSPESMTNQH